MDIRLTGKQFKAEREAMGLSVSQLADLLDVNRSTIFRIEQTECTRVMSLAMDWLATKDAMAKTIQSGCGTMNDVHGRLLASIERDRQLAQRENKP